MRHSSSIGVDVHAKANSVCALVHDIGEVREVGLSFGPAELVVWIRVGLYRNLACYSLS